MKTAHDNSQVIGQCHDRLSGFGGSFCEMMPSQAAGWWQRHYTKVCIGLGAVTVCYCVFVQREAGRVTDVVHDYGVARWNRN
jgi:hypothetical protein